MTAIPKPAAGRGWAYLALVLGGGVSIAANVAHSFIPPADVADAATWSPEPGAVLLSIVWPVFLFIAVEVLAKPSWPTGAWWRVLRFGGMVPVAAVAAVVSYRHLSGLLDHYGEDALTVAIGPLAVDGLMAMATGALIATSHAAHRAADQAWFWTPEWQAGEHEASEQIAAGDTTSYESMDALVADTTDTQQSEPVTASVPARPKPARRGPSTADRVAKLRQRHPGMTQAEAAKRLGVTDRTIRRHWNPAPVEPTVTSDPAAPVAA
ncbi:helix-turn-helix domain-containing protein [Cryptosporangium sp. NPDC051539]|uniref:helix-turn-helix domain-containing protein n=1 Tax=Cryptosporangium sp. NPDC051539 TaxID=3363962 RepID=UPI00378C7935